MWVWVGMGPKLEVAAFFWLICEKLWLRIVAVWFVHGETCILWLECCIIYMNRSSGWMWVWVDVGVGVWRFQEHDTTRTLRHPHLFHPYCQEHAWVVWVWVHPKVGVGATHTHLLPC